MLSLKSFHVFLIAAAMMLLAGLGVWGLLNSHIALGSVGIALSIVLLIYWAYFAVRAQRI